MTTANESKLGGARGGHRGPIVLRVAAARVLPLLPVAARGARLVLSMGLAAGCVRARSSSSPLRGGHCPPSAASTAISKSGCAAACVWGVGPPCSGGLSCAGAPLVCVCLQGEDARSKNVKSSQDGACNRLRKKVLAPPAGPKLLKWPLPAAPRKKVIASHLAAGRPRMASDLGPLSGGQPGRTGTPDQRREKQVLRDPAGIRVG